MKHTVIRRASNRTFYKYLLVQYIFLLTFSQNFFVFFYQNFREFFYMVETYGLRRLYLHIRELMGPDDRVTALWNASRSTTSYCLSVLDYYGEYIGQYCIGMIYRIYMNFTVFNTVIFLLQYVPMGFYMYKTVKNIYTTSRERIRTTKSELADIELEIEIVRSKLCVRDYEFMERAEKLRQEAERLQRVRARVRQIISTDDLLRQAMDTAPVDAANLPATPEEEHNYIMQLINELNSYQTENNDSAGDEMEPSSAATEVSTENSVYSSVSESDVKQDDCRVKMVKVANVYKVSYLKHYIKQKRLRRANKQALLKKKMEGIKKLLEDWQKTLNMVINNQLSIFNIDSHPIDVLSQEAMGDFSKPDLRSVDSDTDIRGSQCELCYDDYCLSWTQNNDSANFEEHPEGSAVTEYYEMQDNGDNVDTTEYSPRDFKFESKYASQPLSSLPEETSSQLAIEELKAEEADDEEDDKDS